MVERVAKYKSKIFHVYARGMQWWKIVKTKIGCWSPSSHRRRTIVYKSARDLNVYVRVCVWWWRVSVARGLRNKMNFLNQWNIHDSTEHIYMRMYTSLYINIILLLSAPANKHTRVCCSLKCEVYTKTLYYMRVVQIYKVLWISFSFPFNVRSARRRSTI